MDSNWQSIREGDLKAFDITFRKYYSLLCNYANFFCKDHFISEEIVQKIFIEIWEKRQQIVIRTSLEKYLYISVKNASYNYFRDNNKYLTSELRGVEIPFNQNDYLELSELQKICDKAIANLPPKCKQIFTLSRDEGLSYREIAEIKGVSLKTVENQLGIALKKLREEIGPHLDIIYSLLILFISNK